MQKARGCADESVSRSGRSVWLASRRVGDNCKSTGGGGEGQQRRQQARGPVGGRCAGQNRVSGSRRCLSLATGVRVSYPLFFGGGGEERKGARSGTPRCRSKLARSAIFAAAPCGGDMQMQRAGDSLQGENRRCRERAPQPARGNRNRESEQLGRHLGLGGPLTSRCHSQGSASRQPGLADWPGGKGR